MTPSAYPSFFHEALRPYQLRVPISKTLEILTAHSVQGFFSQLPREGKPDELLCGLLFQLHSLTSASARDWVS